MKRTQTSTRLLQIAFAACSFALLSLVQQTEARAQVVREDATAQAIVEAVVAAQATFHQQYDRYAQASELFGVPAYRMPVDLQTAGDHALSIVIPTDGSTFFVSADGKTKRFVSSTGKVESYSFAAVDEHARNVVREIISAQAQHYAQYRRYGTARNLAEAGLLDTAWGSNPGYAGIGVFFKIEPAADGQSHAVRSAGYNALFGGDQTGEIKELESASAVAR